MDLYTYNVEANPPILGIPQAGTFSALDIIDDFESLIWTERYYGDSEAQIILPIDETLIGKFPMDRFIGIDESDELLMVDTVTIEDGRVNVKAISVLTWLNNRFVRTAKDHRVLNWVIEDFPPGQILWEMLYQMTNQNSDYLIEDTMGIPQAWLNKLIIPEIGLSSFDSSDDPISSYAISFAPLFDEMMKIATAYQIGMQIRFELKIDPYAEKPLGFRSYKGLNKTRAQDSTLPKNSIVRFSQKMESLENLKQVKSGSIYKTVAFAFGSTLQWDLNTWGLGTTGVAFIPGTDADGAFTGFGCRAAQVFADDLAGFDGFGDHIPTEGAIETVDDVMNGVAKNALEQAVLIEAADGDIVPTSMFRYGRDYSLGDIVEVEGLDGVISAIRVTEHIIAEDSSGEKGYVTTGDPTESVIN